MKDNQAQAEIEPVVPRYMTVDQAAVYLGFSPKTLYLWVSKRRIPFIEFPGKRGKHRNGGALRFERLALDGFMRQHAVKPLALWDSPQNS